MYLLNLHVLREAGWGRLTQRLNNVIRNLRFFPKVAQSTGSGARLFRSESQVYLILTVLPWTNDLTSLSPSLLLCEKQNNSATPNSRVVVSTKAGVGRTSL